jgi:hypothetical protein
VKTWLPRPRSGPVFRAEALGGMVSDMALADGEAIRRGLDPAVYSGHSLRAGLLTSAAEAGASVFKMMEVSRHNQYFSVTAVKPA